MRRLSATRSIDWLAQARYKALALRQAPMEEAFWPICARCNVGVGAVSFEDQAQKGHAVDFRARCDHPEHQGSREDVIRATFDWKVEIGGDDFNRALRGCIFFPRASDV